MPDDRADAGLPAETPQGTECLGCGQPIPAEALVCPRCERAARDNATGRQAWRTQPRKPFQFGLSTLFLVMLATTLVLGWATPPSYVDLTFAHVVFDPFGAPVIDFRVTRCSGSVELQWEEFTDDGKPIAQSCCFGNSHQCGARDITLPASSLGIAPPWQAPVWLVRPGETYRVTPGHPLRLLRCVDGQGNVTCVWMFLGPASNVRDVCPKRVGPPGGAAGGPSPASGKPSNGSTIGK
ncbi:MAG: hypothetical protein ACLQLG_09390 [Thermoguttaceae bacterium]